jgi:hypothetical protein
MREALLRAKSSLMHHTNGKSSQRACTQSAASVLPVSDIMIDNDANEA